MSREVTLSKYLPEVLADVRDFKELTAAEDPEFTLYYEKADIVLDDCFVDTLDAYGCARWEKMLALAVKDTDTLDLRRLRIKAALNGDTPYTMRSLAAKLETLCGKGNFTLAYANDEYTLKVGLALAAKAQFDYIKTILKGIVPANVIIDVFLLYNKHSLLADYTHAGLHPYTHKQLREEVL